MINDTWEGNTEVQLSHVLTEISVQPSGHVNQLSLLQTGKQKAGEPLMNSLVQVLVTQSRIFE